MQAVCMYVNQGRHASEACKLYFPKLEAKKIGPKVKEPLLSITSVKQLDSDKDYLIFANYVYDVAPLRLHHPAGFQII